MYSKLKFSKDRKILSKLPQVPGVYLFWQGERIIYVGKAVNLRNRVSSYVAKGLSSKTLAMVNGANAISFIKVGSELDSLLLEAWLIKRFQPHYNFAAKDDKNPLYIKITKEEFPRITTARKIEENEQSISFYGPFPSSSSVKGVLKSLRRIFPYAEHKPGKRVCIYSHLGLCNPCPSLIAFQKDEKLRHELKERYLENIRLIRLVLERKTDRVEKMLLKRMEGLSKNQQFEEAKLVRDRLLELSYVTQKPIPVSEFLKNPNLLKDIRNEEMKALVKLLGSYISLDKLERIECFDVAHLAGLSPTASMVTFIQAEAEKRLYRRFKINQKLSKSDVDSLAEVARRRLIHLKDWGVPDLAIVDGGKPQVAVFGKYFESYKIPVVGIAKRFETLVIPVKKLGAKSFKEVRVPEGPALRLVTRIRDEAHRFSRKYHHILVKKQLIPSAR